MCVLLLAADEARTGPATEKRFPPLKVPPGFKATLFACDPLIEYPSVIAAGPRAGAIFVAIDYVSGLGPPVTRKSEIRLVEDTDGDGYADKATVVAKEFNSIQGIAYQDGAIYVMHAPFLTKLRISKKTRAADERKDLLIGLGLPPEQNPSRLHCANGVTIGHDGWLYLAQGDNGIDVPRPEGDQLIHHGGAILRCRPDGRDLHVFSTGWRNIYDVALDAELNVFTRDNENDGGTYMIRVCHSFHGADHGYPYDYYERPEHAMKPIGDFGLGSSAGGVCYLETQLPPAYRGNLFFCEWGKSVVRYELNQSASGFAPVKEFEFATGDPKDAYPFKPTDVIVQRDGSLMVSDYADGQRPKRGRGRIYRIAYVRHDSKRAEKKATTDIEQLNSPSYVERCEGQATVERLRKRPALANLNRLGRMHAIWALAHTDGAAAIAPLLRIAGEEPDGGVRAQAIRAIADLADPVLVKHQLDAGRGDAKLAAKLAALAVADDPRVQREVVIALGRLRWAGAPQWLAHHLRKPDGALEHAAMQTMRRADSWPAVVKLLDLPRNAPMRQIALRALADRHEPTVVEDLTRRLGADADPKRRAEYADLLTRIHKKPGPWKYWGYRPGPRPANTEKWERTEAIEQALDGFLSRRDQSERAFVLARMQREQVPVRLATLVGLLKSEHQPAVVQAMLSALSAHPAADLRAPLDAVVRDAKHSPANRQTALDMLLKAKTADAPILLTGYAKSLEEGAALADVLRRLGAYPKHASVAVIAPRLKSKDAGVRAAAMESLGELRAADGAGFVMPFLSDPHIEVRRAAAGASGKLGVKDAIEPLLTFAADPELRLACLNSLRLLREPRVVPIAVTSLHDRRWELAALECLRELGGPEQMREVVDFARRGPSADAVAASVRALATWPASPAQRPELDRAIAEIHGASGVLVRWHAGAPIPPDAKLKTIERFGVLGQGGDWRQLFALGAEARVLLAPKGDATNPLWFAYTDVAVANPAAIEFLASSRGGLEVWLNGKSIHRRGKAKTMQIDSDRFAATLDKGVNRVLVETGNPGGAVEFHLHFRHKSAKAEHEKLAQAALARPGNAGRGSKIFFDKERSQCLKCHQLGNQGERIGPDLTGVGARFSRIHLIESILEPSRTIAPSFGTFVVTLKSGKTLNGAKVAEDAVKLTFADNQGVKHVLQRKDVDEVQPSPLSIMPDGLEQRLTIDEFVDLIAFLTNQK